MKQPTSNADDDDDDDVKLDYATLDELRGDEEGPLDHPCPLCGPDRETEYNRERKVLRTWDLAPGVISYYCARCEAKGSAQADVLSMLRPYNQPRNPSKVPPAKRPAKDDKLKLVYVERLWAQATPKLPAEAIAYFRWRGIPLDDVPNGALRVHPHCPWRGKTSFCIVARYTDALTGAPKGLWRRSIRDGKPMTIGPQAGCVIRLWPQAGKTLVVGEGVESTLAAATKFPYRIPLRPAWAAGSAGNMRRLPVIDGVEHLILLVDNDISGAGQEAAAACAHRWCAAGRKVTRLIPKQPQSDFNDLVRAL